MPFVEINITEGPTDEQKAELVEGVTDLLVKVLNKNPASTHVMIKEHATDSWGISGRTVKKLRAEGHTQNISKE